MGLKIRLEFTSAQKFGSGVMVQWRCVIILWLLNWYVIYAAWWTLDHSEPHHRWHGDEVVYVDVAFVNSEMLPTWKLLLLFAESEYGFWFMAHTPGWSLESFVGVERALEKYRFPVPPQKWLNQNFSERAEKSVLLTGSLGNCVVFGKLCFVRMPQLIDLRKPELPS